MKWSAHLPKFTKWLFEKEWGEFPIFGWKIVYFEGGLLCLLSLIHLHLHHFQFPS